jgi:hypothetical protein
MNATEEQAYQAFRDNRISHLTEKIREHQQLLKESEDWNERMLQSNALTVDMYRDGERHRATLKRVIAKTRASLRIIEAQTKPRF